MLSRVADNLYWLSRYLERPENVAYDGAATALRDTWLDLRTAMRGVLEETSLADLVARAGSPRAPAEAS